METQTDAKMSILKRLKSGMWIKFNSTQNAANEARLRRRRKLAGLFTRRLTLLKYLLLFIGYGWMIIIPSSRLGRTTYIDENALQPSQVNTHWNWEDVHTADLYLEQLEALRDQNATSQLRAQFLMTEFQKLGLSSSTQNYKVKSWNKSLEGTNTYAVLASPRGPGTEAMVISASWLSRTCDGDGTLNLRGVSTVLSLSAFLKRYSLWAKDIIFVISDGYLDGMHAWLSAYHGTRHTNLQTDDLELSSGVIWTALNIDYPGHSFSHLGIFHEGLNGRLPNQDLLNSFQRISLYTGGVPVTVYDHIDPQENGGSRSEDFLSQWLPESIRNNHEVKDYLYRAKNVLRHIGYQSRGRASGVHGLFHQFRIDAFTLYAVPAVGPHGFHAIGRIAESTLRTMNNLLERLHASFFFYMLTGPNTFLKIGSYIPSAILVSIAMMIQGLKTWADAAPELDGTKQNSGIQNILPSQTKRPVLEALAIMFATHILGACLFVSLNISWFINKFEVISSIAFILFASIPLTFPLITRGTSGKAKTAAVMKAFNLCLASSVVSAMTILNFSLAAVLAVFLGIPLILAHPSTQIPTALVKYLFYVTLSLSWLLFFPEDTFRAVWEWYVLSVWFAPFVCIVYAPLVLQAALVCLAQP